MVAQLQEIVEDIRLMSGALEISRMQIRVKVADEIARKLNHKSEEGDMKELQGVYECLWLLTSRISDMSGRQLDLISRSYAQNMFVCVAAHVMLQLATPAEI